MNKILLIFHFKNGKINKIFIIANYFISYAISKNINIKIKNKYYLLVN